VSSAASRDRRRPWHHRIRLPSERERPGGLAHGPANRRRPCPRETRALRAESGRVFARDQSQVGRDTRGRGKAFDIVHRGDHPRGRDRANTRDRHQSRHPLVGMRQCAKRGIGVGHRLAHRLSRHQHPRQVGG
jgi:hypothetical protein